MLSVIIVFWPLASVMFFISVLLIVSLVFFSDIKISVTVIFISSPILMLSPGHLSSVRILTLFYV